MNQTRRIKSGAINNQQTALPLQVAEGISWLNIGLAIMALGLLTYYVVQVNRLAAQTWNTEQAQTRLAAILDERNSLVARQSELDDRQVLQALAAKEGLEPAGAVVYLVQDTAVAKAQ